MLGDGINDSLAVAAALLRHPALDRPSAARSDFYLVTAGLRLARLAWREPPAGEGGRRILAAALAYNALAVGIACAGLMSPLLCAVFMPLSSLSIILATRTSLSEGAPWKSSVSRSSSA